jgi:hypothetical protein
VVHPLRRAPSAGTPVPPGDWSLLTGTYASDEVLGEPYAVVLESGALVLRQSPGTRWVLTPAADGRFQFSGGLIGFVRTPDGRASALSVQQDRAWEVAFRRTP